MKAEFRKLQRLSKIIDFDMFYSIDISRYGQVSLQGEYSPEKVVSLQKYFKFHTDSSGYLEGLRLYDGISGYKITFTS